MFYSHEILTSPEHGVATIWLVATLGSRSVSRRLNRKAILDVDVPNACRVIINPEAPMALRLQGSLLYGVSRVYNQQCGYTLLDTQAMHDKMITQLKIIPGSGLDPTAGQARPSTLVLPYDPSFLPETGLPGLDIDLSYIATVDDGSKLGTVWANSPINSLSGVSQLSSLQIELPSDGAIGGDYMLGFEDVPPVKDNVIVQVSGLGLEEGVLLQPDFEFDEDGNLIELESRVRSPRRSAEPRSEHLSEREQAQQQPWDDHMQIDTETVNLGNGAMEIDMVEGPSILNKDTEAIETIEVQPIRARRARKPKELFTDGATALRNLDLAQWNNEYVSNMADARKQKQQNKIPRISKKNAAFWVFGCGIGGVGSGLGQRREPHPLNQFSGEELLNAVCGHKRQPKRSHSPDDNERRVRTRSEELSRENIDRLNMDVEIGRDAPSSILDDRSSQMPWNITASIKSSLRPHRFGSVSESSRKGRSRLASASPLAGRGYRDIEDIDFGEDLDLTRYLEDELATDREHISSISPGKRSMIERAKANLDRESLNFYEFMKSKMGIASDQSPHGDVMNLTSRLDSITFESLMPTVSTTRAVATQALVNVLTLATRGVVRIDQDRSGTGALGANCSYGDIKLRLAGV
ncbi:hypothetical protein N7452_007920 [Penicillium brevicompactum]|uniref:Rad21/Rec8-like protein N-terminal domain-containing protein n=1 Tax=Penicillium brevicompactum TaxID=5074 RepID=A0A9W9UFA6_PENBR|nr:hypothetical protein N7452_007920 [Penicillium brevicompactum]